MALLGTIIRLASNQAVYGHYLGLSKRIIGSMEDGKLSFVVEADSLQSERESLESDFCRKNSSPELRPWIEDCHDRISVRMLTPEEERQMETFKTNSEEGKLDSLN